MSPRTHTKTVFIGVLIAIFIGAVSIGASTWFSHSHLNSSSASSSVDSVQPADISDPPTQQAIRPLA